MDALRAAYRFLDAHHAAAVCSPPRRVMLLCLTNSEDEMLGGDVKRAGISNDLNTVLSAFWRALVEGRQLVIVDPGAADPTSRDNSASASWHWLDRHTPISDVLVPSACQRELERMAPPLRRRLSCFNTSRARRVELATEIGFSSDAVGASISGAGPALGLSDEHVPEQFRAYGAMWWLQVVTTYVVRVRGQAASRLRARAYWSRLTPSDSPTPMAKPTETLTAGAADGQQSHTPALDSKCSAPSVSIAQLCPRAQPSLAERL